MSSEFVGILVTILLAAIAGLTTLFIWLSRARETDIFTKHDLELLRRDLRELRASNEHLIALLEKDLNYIKDDVRENRTEREKVEEIVFRLINFLNVKHKMEFEYVETRKN
jgi:hypothetical protein